LFDEISEIERRLYPASVTANFENAHALLDTLLDSEKRRSFGTSSAQQMNLPEI
jgi:hypothetical protein